MGTKLSRLMKCSKRITLFYHKTSQVLAMEMYKISNNMFLTIFKNVFAPKVTPHNLHNSVKFKMQEVHGVYIGTETLSHLGRKFWSIVPDKIRQSVSLSDLKSKIKKWTLSNCPCRLCKKYLHHVRLI